MEASELSDAFIGENIKSFNGPGQGSGSGTMIRTIWMRQVTAYNLWCRRGWREQFINNPEEKGAVNFNVCSHSLSQRTNNFPQHNAHWDNGLNQGWGLVTGTQMHRGFCFMGATMHGVFCFQEMLFLTAQSKNCCLFPLYTENKETLHGYSRPLSHCYQRMARSLPFNYSFWGATDRKSLPITLSLCY